MCLGEVGPSVGPVVVPAAEPRVVLRRVQPAVEHEQQRHRRGRGGGTARHVEEVFAQRAGEGEGVVRDVRAEGGDRPLARHPGCSQKGRGKLERLREPSSGADREMQSRPLSKKLTLKRCRNPHIPGTYMPLIGLFA